MTFSPNLSESKPRLKATETAVEQASAEEKKLLELYNLALERKDYLRALDLAEKIGSPVLLNDVIEQGIAWAENCGPREWGVRKGIALVLHHVQSKLAKQETA